jgi:hypothetical protein
MKKSRYSTDWLRYKLTFSQSIQYNLAYVLFVESMQYTRNLKNNITWCLNIVSLVHDNEYAWLPITQNVK